MGFFKRRPHAKVEFEPAGVKESLIEMKDLSEQIIDLSYAAIIFDSKDIAEEVDGLEELDELGLVLGSSVFLESVGER